MKRLILLLFLVTAPVLAQSNRPPAALADTQLPDPEQEREAKALMATLRCIVCQGQAIADSDAEMAGDMRALVRERIAKGEDANAVRDWLIERYGDYVSYKPEVSASTWPLFAIPALLVLVADSVVRILPLVTELRLGIALSLLGAPFFLWLLLRMRKGAL